MLGVSSSSWKQRKTPQTLFVEEVLRQQFARVDCYRYNSASIRLRVVDSRFEGLSHEQRDAIIEPFLAQLPEETQADILRVFLFSPSELEGKKMPLKVMRLNDEFENPDPSLSCSPCVEE